MIISKYSGVSHSPKQASRRRIDLEQPGIERTAWLARFLRGRELLGLSPASSLGWPSWVVDAVLPGQELSETGRGFWLRPAPIATDVWMHRKNGELCMTTLYCLPFFGDADGKLVARSRSSISFSNT